MTTFASGQASNMRRAETQFVGREQQLADLRACAHKALAGKPCLVLLQGEAGIGKTALVRQFLDDLENFTVLQAVCDRAETDYPFGVIGQLAARAPADILAQVPMLAGAIPADAAAFQVGGQLLKLLGRLQDSGPVVMVVDDTQWVDGPSVQALGFVLRRLWADRVLTVLMSRSASFGADEEVWQRLAAGKSDVFELQLGGLDPAEIAELAEKSGAGTLDVDAADRLHEHTEGHPLYLQRLLADLPNEVLSDNFTELPVPGTLALAIQRRLDEFPADSRRLVETLAVLDARCPLSLVAAVAGIDDAARALEPVVTSGLVDWAPGEPSTPVEIHHQLQRQAIYEALEPARRRELHNAAVPLVAPDMAWAHRVAGTDSVDAGLASELEHAAAATFMAGSVDQAATWMLWAAELSDRREEHERRLLQAVYYLITVIAFSARARQLRPRVEACSPSPMRSAILGHILYNEGKCITAEEHLTAAFEATTGTPELASIGSLAGNSLVLLYTWINRNKESLVVSRRAAALDAPNIAHWKEYLSIFPYLKLMGPKEALRRLDDVGLLPEQGMHASPDLAGLLLLRGLSRLLAGSLSAAVDDLTAALRISYPRMPTRQDAFANCLLSLTEYLQGAWDDAAVHIDYGVELMTAEKNVWYYAPSHMVAAMLAAGRGDETTAEEHLRLCSEAATSIDSSQLFFPALAAAAVAQARADHAGMLNSLNPALRMSSDAKRSLDRGWMWIMQNLWRPLEIEALIGTSRFEEAREALGELREFAADVPGLKVTVGWLAGWLAEASGDVTTARDLYEVTLEVPAHPDEVALHRARLHHSYGRLLLALRDRRGARSALRAAHHHYVTLGARPFLDRCDQDLESSGLHTVDDPSGQLLALTDREREVANLVKRGITNAEIAAELFVSVKTVEYHLGNVYSKYNVTSRKQLRELLASSSD